MTTYTLPKRALVLLTLSALLAQTAAAQTYEMRVAQPGLRPATSPRLNVPGPLAFGSVAAGYYAQQPLHLVNAGTADLVITDVSVSAGSPTFSAAHACERLAPGASCPVEVTFSPSSANSYSGTVTVTSNDGAGPRQVALSGTGSAAQLSVSQSAVDFGARQLGSTTSASVTLSNSGNADTGLVFSTLAAPFSMTSTTCGPTLAAGASCIVTAAYAPQSAGSFAGALTINGSAGAAATVGYTGSTTMAVLATSVSSYNFGAVAAGTTSSHTLTVSNTGSVSTGLTFSTLSAPYSRNGGTCGATLAAGASCSFIAKYAPTSASSSSATLTVSGDNGVASRSVAYSGTGQVAVLATSVSSYNFGTVAAGATSSHTLTVSNTGPVATTLSFTGLAAPYAQTGGTCNATLAAGATCTYVVSFAPTAAASYTDTLSVAGGVGVTAKSVTYSGAGVVGQQAYTVPGTYTWTAPAGVTQVAVVAVGGGASCSTSGNAGGGGGGLGWRNAIAVTPGAQYTVVVGAYGDKQANGPGQSGGSSYFQSTSVVMGGGGQVASVAGVGGAGGSYAGTGGGAGGAGGAPNSSGGGGGAGGYAGSGGQGGSGYSNGSPGAGGGGGGGNSSNGSSGGGGVGLFGQGASGLGGLHGLNWTGTGGGGGSGGGAGNTVITGGTYGGGGGCAGSINWSKGGGGAVRIIWGANRAFPSTNTANL